MAKARNLQKWITRRWPCPTDGSSSY